MDKLTDAAVRAAKVPAGSDRLELRDGDVKGLELRVTKDGTKTWRFVYWFGPEQKNKRVTLGTYPGMGLSAARAMAGELRTEVRNGGDPAAGVAAYKAELTFSELAGLWLADKEDEKAARSLADNRGMLARHINPEIGRLKVSDIERRHVAAMLDKVKRAKDARFTKSEPDGRMSVRANRVFECVRAIFTWGRDKGHIETNPCEHMDAPVKKRAENIRKRILSAGETRAFWTACEGASEKRRAGIRGAVQKRDGAGIFSMTRATAIALQLALVTGQRIGEVAATRIRDLQLDDVGGSVWTVPADVAKNRSEHRVPLTGMALDLVKQARQLADGSEFLFPNSAGSEHVASAVLTKAWERSRAALGMADVNAHDFRRTALSRMAEAGTPDLVVSLIANHISVTKGSITKRVYNQHPYDAEKRDGMERWEKLLRGTVAGEAAQNVVAFPSRATA